MPLEKISVCPACRNTEFADHLTVKDYTTSGEDFSIVRCTACDLGVTNPRPEAASIGKYYQSAKYISHTGGGFNLTDLIYRKARSFMHARKKRIIENYQSPATILDYGCGTGEFLQFMRMQNWNTIGVEPNEGARTKASLLNPSSIYDSLEKVATHKVEAITLWHVAEHIHELNSILEELKNKLHENGVLFIAVPNYQSPDAFIYKNYWAGYDVPRHLWHFSKKSIESLITNHGMKIVNILPMILDAYYISYVSEQYKDSKAPTYSALIKGIIKGWKSNMLAKATVNYSSLLYIIKK